MRAGALVRCLEPLNALARQHWKAFARQNYFDPHGIFVGAVVAAPLLLSMFVALVRRAPGDRLGLGAPVDRASPGAGLLCGGDVQDAGGHEAQGDTLQAAAKAAACRSAARRWAAGQ